MADFDIAFRLVFTDIAVSVNEEDAIVFDIVVYFMVALARSLLMKVLILSIVSIGITAFLSDFG